jgi:hypothetical protein
MTSTVQFLVLRSRCRVVFRWRRSWMTYRKAKKQIREDKLTVVETIHEGGIYRLQVVTKKGKPKTLTVDR